MEFRKFSLYGKELILSEKIIFKQRDCMQESYKDEFEQLLLIQILMDFFFSFSHFCTLQSLDFVCVAISYFADITQL